jgi:hypothetical protein
MISRASAPAAGKSIDSIESVFTAGASDFISPCLRRMPTHFSISRCGGFFSDVIERLLDRELHFITARQHPRPREFSGEIERHRHRGLLGSCVQRSIPRRRTKEYRRMTSR